MILCSLSTQPCHTLPSPWMLTSVVLSKYASCLAPYQQPCKQIKQSCSNRPPDNTNWSPAGVFYMRWKRSKKWMGEPPWLSGNIKDVVVMATPYVTWEISDGDQGVYQSHRGFYTSHNKIVLWVLVVPLKDKTPLISSIRNGKKDKRTLANEMHKPKSVFFCIGGFFL